MKESVYDVPKQLPLLWLLSIESVSFLVQGTYSSGAMQLLIPAVVVQYFLNLLIIIDGSLKRVLKKMPLKFPKVNTSARNFEDQ